MQRVIQRTERAVRTANRRHAKIKLKQERDESWERKQTASRLTRGHTQIRRNAVRLRHEDWQLGPLTPRSDVGERAHLLGTFDPFNFRLAEREPRDRPDWWHIAVGDRVVVIRGREKGKIGEVDLIDEEEVSVRVKDVNQIYVEVPKFMADERQSEPAMQIAQSIPLEDVRLVFPMPDPVTKVPRDVIIERLVRRGEEWDPLERKYNRGERVIAGTKTIIPWPEEAEETAEEYTGDTPRILVDEETFRPYLLQTPMPPSVIDELRGRYSRFRTRHDPEYIQKVEAREARLTPGASAAAMMRTPLQELKELREKQREVARRNRELTPQQLADIGAVIEQQQKLKAGLA